MGKVLDSLRYEMEYQQFPSYWLRFEYEPDVYLQNNWHKGWDSVVIYRGWDSPGQGDNISPKIHEAFNGAYFRRGYDLIEALDNLALEGVHLERACGIEYKQIGEEEE